MQDRPLGGDRKNFGWLVGNPHGKCASKHIRGDSLFYEVFSLNPR